MFEQVFKSLDDIMFQEPGCNSELDYAEQSSWMLFLKYLDDMENERALEAQMTGKVHCSCSHCRIISCWLTGFGLSISIFGFYLLPKCGLLTCTPMK